MFLDFMSGVDPRMLIALSGLCSAEGDPPGGGGPNPGFSQEQLDYLTTFESKLITQLNSAITSRDKRTEKQLGEKLDAIVAKLAESKAPPPDPDEPTGKKGKSNHDDVALQTMQRRLDEMQQRADAADAMAKAERAKNRDIERKRVLGDLLVGIGITDPARQRHAIAFIESMGNVQYEDDEGDRLVWRDGMNAQVELPVGVRQWAKTDDAKHFISPTIPRGSGSSPGNKGGGGAPLTNDQRLARIDELIRQNF